MHHLTVRKKALLITDVKFEGETLTMREFIEKRSHETPMIKDHPIEFLITAARAVDNVGSFAKTLNGEIRKSCVFDGHPGHEEVQRLSALYNWHEEDIDALFKFWTARFGKTGCVVI